MKLARSLSPLLLLAIAAVGASAWSAQDDQHQAHHPANAASASSAKVLPRKPGPDTARMDVQMKAMQQMHDKMMAAKTPEERNALMAEHMKTMQDGMTLMDGMTAETGKTGMNGDMSMRHQTMEKRMDMMQSMMQMVMDRLPVSSGK